MMVKLCLKSHFRGPLKQVAVGKERISNLQRTAAGAQEVPEEAVLGMDMEEGGKREGKRKGGRMGGKTQKREKLKEGRERGGEGERGTEGERESRKPTLKQTPALHQEH